MICHHVDKCLCFCRRLLPTWFHSTDMMSGSPAPWKPGTHLKAYQSTLKGSQHASNTALVSVSGRRTAASSSTTGRRWSIGRTDTAGRKGRMEKQRERTTWSWRSRAWRSASARPPLQDTHSNSIHSRKRENTLLHVYTLQTTEIPHPPELHPL